MSFSFGNGCEVKSWSMAGKFIVWLQQQCEPEIWGIDSDSYGEFFLKWKSCSFEERDLISDLEFWRRILKKDTHWYKVALNKIISNITYMKLETIFPWKWFFKLLQVMEIPLINIFSIHSGYQVTE